MFPEYDPTHSLYWPNLVSHGGKSSGQIPKIIHQIWIGPKKRPQKLMNTWRDKNPTWQHIIWSEENLSHWQWINQNHIDAMPEWNGKADIMRYEILYRFGGFFVDADSVCLNPLDNFFLENDSFTCYENEKARGALLATGYMGASKHNRLMLHVIEELQAQSTVGTPAWWYVGPVFFTWVVQKHQYPNLTVYPSYFFIPNHYTNNNYPGAEKVYADQLWGTAKNLYGELD